MLVQVLGEDALQGLGHLPQGGQGWQRRDDPGMEHNIIFVAVRGGVGDGSCALNLSNAKNVFAYFVLVSKCVRWNLQAVWLGPPLLTPNELHPITVSV